MAPLIARPPDRPVLMGVVNVTPDSFSDGGRWFDVEGAVAHGQELLAQGADVLDVGGESTRPGAQRPDAQEEARRVVPVVRELSNLGATVSIDTMRAQVAAAALGAGAAIVNDVSGGLADAEMAAVVADAGAPFVAMHWRGHSHDMQTRAVYGDVVTEVVRELQDRVEALTAAGVAPEKLVLDPGLGFAKSAEHNWTLIARIDQLARRLGLPILVGTSRKTFLGAIGAGDGNPVPPSQRDPATAATSVLLAQAGVWGLRVHDIVSTRAAVEVVARVRDLEVAR